MIINSFKQLKNYCEAENFAGWDPYDGLNSKVFQALPLKYWSLARLACIQTFKRSPFNFRRILFVPKGHNAKGIGLFLSAYCVMYHMQKEHRTFGFGTQEEILCKINELATLLISLKTEGYSGSCWGYNFDWQARGGLFFPAGTPTVVATAFAAYGLMDAFDITGNQEYLEEAISSSQFVIKDLKRTEKQNGSFLFSYSPLPGNNRVYNASLLGSKLLSRIYFYTKNEALIEPATLSVRACLDAQESDGSWIYGELPIQNWKDSYHTGFNLVSLHDYMVFTGDKSVLPAIEKGFQYYISNFFLDDGTPKYYHNEVFPVDIHSPAQLIITLAMLNKFDEHTKLADKVLDWTNANMKHPTQGYYYYQLKKRFSSKIPYMRWSQSWMAYSLSLYHFNKIKKQEKC